MAQSARQPKLYKNTDKKRSSSSQPTGPLEKYRSEFRRDFARLLHCPAFRRLQGKTQLFPSHESDFFRNRLTHSLEVAQIAKSIANKLNDEHHYFSRQNIDTDLVEFAALAHDLGHPPFGHNGEEALDQCMADSGGFEGNAQTLRILARLEKRVVLDGVPNNAERLRQGKDQRCGLNVTYRSLAAILKYDQKIPRQLRDRGSDHGVSKGYYYTEEPFVAEIHKNVGIQDQKPLRTIECSIMDIADDIAYSTYDLEDAFKARFITPASLIATDEAVARSVCATIEQRLRKYYPAEPRASLVFEVDNFYETILTLFSSLFETEADMEELFSGAEDSDSRLATFAEITSQSSALSDKLGNDGYYRSSFTSELVKRALDSVEVVFNEAAPQLSIARLNISSFKEVETLKNIVFQTLILSPMLKISAYRGRDIVKKIFDALDKNPDLLPTDFRTLHESLAEPDEKKRVICDFIAGMTDRYAVQFYSRLFGTSPETIHSPL